MYVPHLHFAEHCSSHQAVNLLAIHGKRVTIMQKDMQALRRVLQIHGLRISTD